MEIIAVFRSRNQAMMFSNLLTKNGVQNRIINTPRSLSLSCGLSVRFLSSFERIAKSILSETKFDSFGGLFLLSISSMGGALKPL